MENINKIKYNTFGEAIAGLKRQFDVNIAVPIGNLILPILSKLMQIFLKISEAVKVQLIPILGQIKDKFIEAFGSNMPDVDKFVDIIISKIPEAFNFLKQYIFPIVTDMITFIQNLGQAGKQEFEGNFANMIKTEAPILIEKIKGIFDVFMSLWDSLSKLSQTEGFKLFVAAVVSGIKNIIGAIITVYKIIIDSGAAIYSVLDNLIQFITNVFSGNWEEAFFNIMKISSSATKFVINLLENLIKWILNIIDPSGKASSAVAGAFNTIRNVIDGALKVAKDILHNFLYFLKNDVPKGFLEFVKMCSKIMDTFNLEKAGKKIIQSLIDGIKSMTGEVGKTVNDIVQGIRNKLPFSPAKEGPLKDLDKTGEGFINTVVKSLEKASPRLDFFIGGLANKLDLGNIAPVSNNSVVTKEQQVIFSGNIIIDSKNVTEFKSVVDFFKNVSSEQTARLTGGV